MGSTEKKYYSLLEITRSLESVIQKTYTKSPGYSDFVIPKKNGFEIQALKSKLQIWISGKGG